MCEFHPIDEREDRPGASVNAFVDELAVLLTNSRIYSPDHPRVQDCLQDLVDGLEEILTREGRPALQIAAADGFLIYDEHPLRGATRSAPRLMHLLESIGSGGLSFERGATAEDVLALMRVVNRRDLEALDLETANGELALAGANRFRSSAPTRRAPRRGTSPPPSAPSRRCRPEGSAMR